ncbi:MAG TPA: sulfatase-like hydrolase/transferase [Actinomycetota bacterium]|nr:sulfatase-like hydrolase/transferase [Actinomycetota bacterium]
MSRPRPLHPVLFAAFPVLNLFQQNLDEVALGQLLVPLGVVVGGALTLLVLTVVTVKDLQRAALPVSLWILLFFSYGYVADAVAEWEVAGVSVGRDRYVLAAWGLLAVAGAFLLLRIRRPLADATRVLNIVAAAMVLVASVPIAVDAVKQPSSIDPVAGSSPLPTPENRAGPKPDIYYVIFDRYGGEEALKTFFSFDNDPFLDSLESRGFVVARDARANYPNTAHSLAAALNMRYLEDLTRIAGSTSSDWRPVYSLLGRHDVGRFLKAQGYRYVHIGSRWEPTRNNPLADENVTFDPLSEFSRTLLDTTPIGPLSRGLGGGEKLDPRRVEWGRVQFQFEQLVRAGNDGKPTFVFAHILLPHEPYVFDRAGTFLTEEQVGSRSWHRNYLEQLMFANEMMTRSVDRLLSGPDGSDPIIVLSSDEGPPPGVDPSNPNPDPESWVTKTTPQLRQKFGILMALHLPGVREPELPSGMTPVNIFRKLLSLYFGSSLPLLPDESYVWEDRQHLYRFVRVTDQVAS